MLFLISAKNSVQVHSDVTSRHCHCCGSVWQWVAGLSDGGVTSGILGSKACNERKTGNSLSSSSLSLSLPLSLSFSFPFPLFFSIKERDGVKKPYFPTLHMLAHKDTAIAKTDRQEERKWIVVQINRNIRKTAIILNAVPGHAELIQRSMQRNACFEAWSYVSRIPDTETATMVGSIRVKYVTPLSHVGNYVSHTALGKKRWRCWHVRYVLLVVQVGWVISAGFCTVLQVVILTSAAGRKVEFARYCRWSDWYLSASAWYYW